ncbi:MAG: polysaccharide lyase 6 family protein [Rikenellaceae bacterium]
MSKIKKLFAIMMLLLCSGATLWAAEYAVSLDEVAATLKQAEAGDKIIVKSGTYSDIELKWAATGTEASPITIMAEEPGSVKIEGASSLRFAGEWLVIDGLHFCNGTQPSGAVIEYRNGQEVAYNCRVTNCVVENYNPEFRADANSYVVLYGRYNRFDHSSLVGKKSLGVTMIVMLNEERSQKNFHRIDHNYFGHRPVYGSNGAETFRAGTSHQAYSSSNTIIEDNIFERCNGEVEVVSIKSSDNIIRRNTFIESEGVLALRHGDRNEVYENLFLGNGKRNTGGVRVINADHKVYNNTFVNVAGTRFFSALALMNAVPNSLPNRYCLVEDVEIRDNKFYDCAVVEFGTGADNERTWAPVRVLFEGNQISNENLDTPYFNVSSVDGITFKDNVVSLSEKYSAEGFKSKSIKPFEMPSEESIREGKGASWWSETKVEVPASPNVYSASAGDDLPAIVAAAEPFSVVELVDGGGDYPLQKAMVVDKPLTIRAKVGLESRPIIRFNGTSSDNMITIADGGDLILEGIGFSGVLEPGKSLASAGVSSDKIMIECYNLYVDNCEFVDFNEGRFFSIRGTKSTFAQKIVIKNTQFRNLSGDAINFASERDDIGRYNAEDMLIENCSFQRLLGIPINIYRGGSDESTAGPFVVIRGCNFEDSCNRERGSAIRMMGPQWARIEDCNFSNSGRGAFSVRLDETNFEDVKVSHCNFYNSGGVLSMTGKVVEGELTEIEPQYTDPEAFDFSIAEGSELYNMGIGIIK